MFTAPLDAEYEYFQTTTRDIVEVANKSGDVHDVSERVKGAIRYIKEALEARGTAYGCRAWTMAIDWYSQKIMGGKTHYEYASGVVQGDSLSDTPLQYWVLPISDTAPYRGRLIDGMGYMVLWLDGYMVDNIEGAFTVDSWSMALEIIQPTDGHAWCPNPECTAQFRIENGVYIVPVDENGNEGERYDPERGEYDVQGMHCPACTRYATDLAEQANTGNSPDNTIITGEAYSTRPNMPGLMFDPYKLQGEIHLDS